MNFKSFYLTEMASLNSVADEDDGDKTFEEILTKNHIGYKDPDEKFNFENVLWARYGKNLFVGFDGKIHPTKAMIVVFVDFRNKWNFPLVYGIETKTKYRNKGLATKIHDCFIKKYGGFITDDSLSYSETNGGVYFVYKKFIAKHPSYEITPKFKIIRKIENIPSPKELNDMDNMNMFLISREELGDDWNELDESITPKKPSKVLTKYKMKNSGLWSAHKLRYKEFVTSSGNKVFVHFKDYGGTKNCEINFETNESFSDKDLNDPEILKNVLFVVLKEVNSKKYDSIEIRPIHRTTYKTNKHVRFDIFVRLIKKYFVDYNIELADKSNYGDMDTILLSRKNI